MKSRSLLCLYGIYSDDREDHSDRGDHHRREYRPHLGIHVTKERGGAKSHCGEDGSAIRLVKIRTHSGDITHVVTHVVSDCGRVSWVVLRNILFHLSDDIRTHVSSLGVDATADSGEKSLGRGSHSESEHRGRDDNKGLRLTGLMHKGVQNHPPDRDVKQSKTYYGKTHDST